MQDIDALIDHLLTLEPKGFSNKDFAAALGVSEGRASQVLKPRLLSGQIARPGDRVRGRYLRGPCRTPEARLLRLCGADTFWRQFVEGHSRTAYVSFAGLGLHQLRMREQIRKALGMLHGVNVSWLLLDFMDVTVLTPSAAEELVRRGHLGAGYPQVQAINAHPAVQSALSHALSMFNHWASQAIDPHFALKGDRRTGELGVSRKDRPGSGVSIDKTAPEKPCPLR